MVSRILKGQEYITDIHIYSNPVPLGDIPSTKTMPSAKFQFPKNFGTIRANKPFTITMAINNLETGDFTNAEAAYFSAPQQLNKQGVITGHSHVVVEQIGSLQSTTLNNPNKFAFFKGLNGQAVNGLLTADVTGGLPAGVYRLSSINSAANHQRGFRIIYDCDVLLLNSVRSF
jgi:hypothetical protein